MLSAQNYNKKEVKSLQNFLNQPSAKEKPNHEQFKRINLNDPSTWEGVTWESGRVTAIDWRGRGLAGDLSVDNFSQLQRIDVTSNQLTSLSASKCSSLAVYGIAYIELFQKPSCRYRLVIFYGYHVAQLCR